MSNYSEIQSSNSKMIGKRITIARKRAGYTQAELGVQLAKVLKRDSSYSFNTISAWEIGRKQPNNNIIMAIARICKCNYLYLLCITDEISDENVDIDSLSDSNVIPVKRDLMKGYEITFSDLAEYHGKPVYIMFPGSSYAPTWGLVDYKNKRFILVDSLLPFDDWKEYVCIYNVACDYKENEHLDAMKRLSPYNIDKYETVYVNYIGNYAKQNACYNGWYHVDNKNHLLYSDSGHSVIFEKMGEIYNAYAPVIN